MKYMIVAGEVSGDLHASHLMEALRDCDPSAEFRFFGGEQMTKIAGHEPVVHIDSLNVMGFSAVLRSLPAIMRNLRTARDLLAAYRPDALILVDFPGFNLKLAKKACKLGIPVHYYISPKLWAWKEWRVKTVKKYVSAMYSILPFEEKFYARHGYRVKYMGNPSVQELQESLAAMPQRNHFFERFGIEDPRPVIALIPGSRRGEVKANLPVMIEACKQFPDYQFIVGGTDSVGSKFYREVAQSPGLNIIYGATHALMKHARVALVTSGTATLETALLGTPQIVCYRSNGRRFAYEVMKRILKVKWVSLPNLIVGDTIIPELLIHQCTPESLARHLAPLLSGSPQRDRQLAGYKRMRTLLGHKSAPGQTAQAIYNSLK